MQPHPFLLSKRTCVIWCAGRLQWNTEILVGDIFLNFLLRLRKTREMRLRSFALECDVECRVHDVGTSLCCTGNGTMIKSQSKYEMFAWRCDSDGSQIEYVVSEAQERQQKFS